MQENNFVYTQKPELAHAERARDAIFAPTIKSGVGSAAGTAFAACADVGDRCTQIHRVAPA